MSRLAIALLAMTVMSATFRARAGEPENVAVARAAYDRGAKAYNAGQYAIAAREFGVADELSPNSVALRYALQAALVLDDPVLGMGLVQRAAGRDDPELALAVRDARARFSGRVGGITLTCLEANGALHAGRCAARIDGAEASGTTWVTPGTHAVEWEGGGMQTVHVDAGQSLEAKWVARAEPTPKPADPTHDAPKPDAEPHAPAREGLSPTYLWVGVGMTTIAAALSIASGVDTLNKHRDFETSRTVASQNTGEAAQLRTNVLFGATAGLALATIVVGFFTFEASPVKVKAYVDLPSRGAGLALDLSYSP